MHSTERERLKRREKARYRATSLLSLHLFVDSEEVCFTWRSSERLSIEKVVFIDEIIPEIITTFEVDPEG